MRYQVLNIDGKIKRSIEAQNVQEAVAKAEELIKADGSYWVQDGWRYVEDLNGKKVALKR